MEKAEVEELIQEAEEGLKEFPADEKSLTKQQRAKKVTLRLQRDTLQKILEAKEKGNVNQEIRLSMDYALLKEYGEKRPLLMYFIKSQMRWWGL